MAQRPVKVVGPFQETFSFARGDGGRRRDSGPHVPENFDDFMERIGRWMDSTLPSGPEEQEVDGPEVEESAVIESIPTYGFVGRMERWLQSAEQSGPGDPEMEELDVEESDLESKVTPLEIRLEASYREESEAEGEDPYDWVKELPWHSYAAIDGLLKKAGVKSVDGFFALMRYMLTVFQEEPEPRDMKELALGFREDQNYREEQDQIPQEKQGVGVAERQAQEVLETMKILDKMPEEFQQRLERWKKIAEHREEWWKPENMVTRAAEEIAEAGEEKEKFGNQKSPPDPMKEYQSKRARYWHWKTDPYNHWSFFELKKIHTKDGQPLFENPLDLKDVPLCKYCATLGRDDRAQYLPGEQPQTQTQKQPQHPAEQNTQAPPRKSTQRHIQQPAQQQDQQPAKQPPLYTQNWTQPPNPGYAVSSQQNHVRLNPHNQEQIQHLEYIAHPLQRNQGYHNQQHIQQPGYLVPPPYNQQRRQLPRGPR